MWEREKKCFGQRNSFECHNFEVKLVKFNFYYTTHAHSSVSYNCQTIHDNDHCIHSVRQLCVLENKAMQQICWTQEFSFTLSLLISFLSFYFVLKHLRWWKFKRILKKIIEFLCWPLLINRPPNFYSNATKIWHIYKYHTFVECMSQTIAKNFLNKHISSSIRFNRIDW